jgi:hypothetical protein
LDNFLHQHKSVFFKNVNFIQNIFAQYKNQTEIEIISFFSTDTQKKKKFEILHRLMLSMNYARKESTIY